MRRAIAIGLALLAGCSKGGDRSDPNELFPPPSRLDGRYVVDQGGGLHGHPRSLLRIVKGSVFVFKAGRVLAIGGDPTGTDLPVNVSDPALLLMDAYLGEGRVHGYVNEVHSMELDELTGRWTENPSVDLQWSWDAEGGGGESWAFHIRWTTRNTVYVSVGAHTMALVRS